MALVVFPLFKKIFQPFRNLSDHVRKVKSIDYQIVAFCVDSNSLAHGLEKFSTRLIPVKKQRADHIGHFVAILPHKIFPDLKNFPSLEVLGKGKSYQIMVFKVTLNN